MSHSQILFPQEVEMHKVILLNVNIDGHLHRQTNIEWDVTMQC